MPRLKEYGDKIAPASVGSKQVAQNPSARIMGPPIQRGRFTRNGQVPDVAAINAMMEQTNQGVLYRTKEVFRGVAPFGPTSAGGIYNGITLSRTSGTTRTRWRFACHTGPYAASLKIVAYICNSNPDVANAPYVQFGLTTNTDGVTGANTVNMHYGPPMSYGGALLSGWGQLKRVVRYIDANADTDYYGFFSDVNGARLACATVYEMTSMTENFSGYLPQNLTSGTDVLDVYREKLVTLQYNLWRRAGATVLNWSTNSFDNTPLSTTSATAKNIIDNSSTTVTAATPGYTLDMTGKERVSQASSGVNVRLQVAGAMTAAGTGGRIYVLDSAGSTVGSIVDGWSSTGIVWVSTTFAMPASQDKYDIHFARAGSDDAGNAFKLYALSMYEYES